LHGLDDLVLWDLLALVATAIVYRNSNLDNLPGSRTSAASHGCEPKNIYISKVMEHILARRYAGKKSSDKWNRNKDAVQLKRQSSARTG